MATRFTQIGQGGLVRREKMSSSKPAEYMVHVLKSSGAVFLVRIDKHNGDGPDEFHQCDEPQPPGSPMPSIDPLAPHQGDILLAAFNPELRKVERMGFAPNSPEWNAQVLPQVEKVMRDLRFAEIKKAREDFGNEVTAKQRATGPVARAQAQVAAAAATAAQTVIDMNKDKAPADKTPDEPPAKKK